MRTKFLFLLVLLSAITPMKATVECSTCWGPLFEQVCLYDGTTNLRCQTWQGMFGHWFCMESYDICSDLPGGGTGKIGPPPDVSN